ncbi:MAG: M23 family metallopeptidase, partial [Lachnospiraceae bacterium]|nr:M23 family metallopeptidase [Lachnospiraceae bacterium]
ILNQVEYMYRITEYDNSLLDRYNEAKQKVIEKENYLEASLIELGSLRDTRQFEQETVKDLMDTKNKEIESFTEKIGITDEMLFTYIDEISDQESEIEEIKERERLRIEEEERKQREREEQAAREDQTRPPSTSGYDASAIDDVVLTDETDPHKFIWPLPGDYRTFSKFGPRKAPLPGATTFHKGWDIGGEFGAPIVSVLAGRVIAATYNSSAGNYVKVDHGNGFCTTYCHMSKILANDGDYVKQGTTLGLVGSTGVSTAPHLHFGVQINGDYVDPAPYMPYS